MQDIETLIIRPATKSKTLILVNHPDRQNRDDFEEIRSRIETMAPEIDIRIVVADQKADEIHDEAWQRPCLIVSFGSLQNFQPKRGLIYHCRPIPKFQQLVKLNRAGIAVPLSERLVFGKSLDKSFWGPLVVLKPTTPGFMSQGAVFLMRTERVAELAEKIFPVGHPARRLPVLVQQFIDTGELPTYYRVLTLFGKPLYCRQGFAANPRPALDASDDVLLKAKIATNAEFVKGRTANDPDVLDLARRAYAAMPAIPLQGVDIIRERTSRRLFVLEVNPGGNTWHFSSQFAKLYPNLTNDRISQFGAWDVAARVLVEKTLHEAR